MQRMLLRLSDTSSDIIGIMKNISRRSKTEIINMMISEWLEKHQTEIENMITQRDAQLRESIKSLTSNPTING